ncbi:MFS transporter [Lentzea alba]|uniref:MFS transporter n=1 Tax=Lentzea alba TaxID=2714351 RepID=UPI0039BF7D63
MTSNPTETDRLQDGSPPPLVPLRRNANFQALWTSESFAAVAKETAEFAYPLLILATTGSALYAGTIASIQVVVAGLVSIPAGSLADRFDRKTLLVVCNLVRVVLLGLFGLAIASDFVTFPLVLGISMASAVFLSLSQPAGIAAIKSLVPPEQVTTAISQNQIRFFGATLLGPPIGGFLFGLNRAFPYLGAALGFVISTLLLFLIKKPLQSPAATDNDGKRHAKEGFKFIRHNPILLVLLTWVMGSNMVFNHTGLFIAIAATAHSAEASSATTGAAVAFAGGGGLIGSLIGSWVIKTLKPRTIMLYAAWVGPVAAILLSFTPPLIVMGVIVGFVFLRAPIVGSLFISYVTVLAPDKLQGRVLGAMFFLAIIVQPLGIFLLGTIFDYAGPTAVFLFIFAVAAPTALLTLTPTIRNLRRPSELEESKA